MKKLLFLVFILTLLYVVVSQLYSYTSLKHKSALNLNSNELSTTSVDGSNIKTAGAIPLNDVQSIESVKQVIKLVENGDISNPKFELITNSGNGLLVNLYYPFDKNKEYFISWLKNNGYKDINPEQFSYKNISK